MSRIAACFAELRAHRRPALLPFVTAGDPDLKSSAALLRALATAGADLIEIGVPFSDPSAEGPTIQRASERALQNGVTLRQVLQLVAELRAQIEVPLILMGYANPFHALGSERFADACAEAGVDGVICSDLPPEEGSALYGALESRGVDGILLAAPTTTPERLAMLMRETRGFLYCVSRTGVTGARTALAAGIEAQVRRARALGDIPLCVGFGVSNEAQAVEVGRFADGVVVGSALIERIEAAHTPAEAVTSASQFVAELSQALTGR